MINNSVWGRWDPGICYVEVPNHVPKSWQVPGLSRFLNGVLESKLHWKSSCFSGKWDKCISSKHCDIFYKKVIFHFVCSWSSPSRVQIKTKPKPSIGGIFLDFKQFGHEKCPECHWTSTTCWRNTSIAIWKLAIPAHDGAEDMPTPWNSWGFPKEKCKTWLPKRRLWGF